MSRTRSSLRSRLMWGLSLTTCLLWGSVAAWQFTSMQRELRAMLDDRLIASAKMVADIVQQILAHNKRDRMLRNQEFIHYFLSSGNIWLAHMDADFRKTVMVQTGVSVLSIVGGLALIAACVFCEVYPLAIYPVAMLVFAWKVGFSFETISKDEKVNARRAMENYKKQYPNDPTVKQNKCLDKSPAWYMTAKKLAKTGSLGRGKADAKPEAKTVVKKGKK